MRATSTGSPNRDHFAAYAATAPIEFESGGRSIRRLSLRGNRQLNHAIHIAAVTQIRHRHSPGRAFYDRKLAARQDEEGSVTRAETADHRRDLPPTPRRRRTNESGPGRASGDDSQSSVTGFEPRTPALRKNHSRTRPNARTRPDQNATTDSDHHLTTKRRSIGHSPRRRAIGQ